MSFTETQRRLADVVSVWLVVYLALLLLTCGAFFSLREPSGMATLSAFAGVAAATLLLTVVSVIKTKASGDRGSHRVLRTVVIACQLALGAALGLACVYGARIVRMNDPGKDNANIALQLHHDAAHPWVGYWKKHCDAQFGLAIDAAGDGKYAIAFCAQHGCLRSGLQYADTPLIGDANYRVVDKDTLQVRERSGFKPYHRCE